MLKSAEERESIINKALHYFNEEGWNCAESVCITMFGDYYKEPVNPQCVTALGGGKVGKCGAVTVAEMAISKKYGRTSPEQTNSIASGALQKFHDVLFEKYGSLVCIELKRYLESERKKIKPDLNADGKVCTPLVEDVMRAVLYVVEGFEPPDFKI
jgi:hypothetical protein